MKPYKYPDHLPDDMRRLWPHIIDEQIVHYMRCVTEEYGPRFRYRIVNNNPTPWDEWIHIIPSRRFIGINYHRYFVLSDGTLDACLMIQHWDEPPLPTMEFRKVHYDGVLDVACYAPDELIENHLPRMMVLIEEELAEMRKSKETDDEQDTTNLFND